MYTAQCNLFIHFRAFFFDANAILAMKENLKNHDLFFTRKLYFNLALSICHVLISLKVERLRAQVAQKDMFISELLDRIAIVECEVRHGSETWHV